MALPPTVRTGHARARPHNGSAMGPASRAARAGREGPLCASAGRERGRRPWLSAARRTDPRQRGCEAEREDTDDGHAPGRPRLTRMPPAARMAGPTRATRHPCPWRGPTLDVLRLRVPCARPGGRQNLRRDAHGLGDGQQRNSRRFVGWNAVASLGLTVFSAPSVFSSCSLFFSVSSFSANASALGFSSSFTSRSGDSAFRTVLAGS